MSVTLSASHPSISSQSSARLSVVTLLASFVFGLWFDATGFGATPLLLATACLLVCSCVLLPRQLPGFFARHPVQGLFLVLLFVLLVVLYQTSLSQDLSFAPSCILGAALISYLLLANQSHSAHMRVWWLLVVVSACIAVFSLWQFFTADIRANKPINDPNNYASLLYLLWIPSLHLLLTRRWCLSAGSAGQVQPAGHVVPTGQIALGLAGTALVMATMFATESRAGLIIVAVALACWWGLALSRRLALSDLAAHTVVAFAVFIACSLSMGTSGVAPGGDNTFTGGMTVRFGLIAEALELFFERPMGAGLGVFAAFYSARRPLWDQVTAGRFVHNDYVQFLLEGGPLLLLALLFIGLWSMFLLRRALAAGVGDAAFARAGFALAACALFAHAHINFVFYLYTLPALLAVVLALAAGADDALPADQPNATPSRIDGRFDALSASLAGYFARLPAFALWVVLALGWVTWGYLALDAVSASVIGGQRGLPFVSQLRESPEAVQRYAQLAQRLNGDRGLPLLADAALAARSSAARPGAEGADEAAHALRTFRRAIAVDPWNTSTYLELYQLFRSRPALLRAAQPEEYPDRLLQRALALDRQYLPALDALLELFRDDPVRRKAVLLQFVAPWLELIARADLAHGKRYLAELEGLIPATEQARLSALLVALGNKRPEGSDNDGAGNDVGVVVGGRETGGQGAASDEED